MQDVVNFIFLTQSFSCGFAFRRDIHRTSKTSCSSSDEAESESSSSTDFVGSGPFCGLQQKKKQLGEVDLSLF